MLVSLGGSAVFLFGLTRASAAQPRSLFGGHLGGALIGIACYHFLGDALWVYALAQALALWFMDTETALNYRSYRFLPEIIAHCVWLDFRLSRNFRDI